MYWEKERERERKKEREIKRERQRERGRRKKLGGLLFPETKTQINPLEDKPDIDVFEKQCCSGHGTHEKKKQNTRKNVLK